MGLQNVGLAMSSLMPPILYLMTSSPTSSQCGARTCALSCAPTHLGTLVPRSPLWQRQYQTHFPTLKLYSHTPIQLSVQRTLAHNTHTPHPSGSANQILASLHTYVSCTLSGASRISSSSDS